MASNTEETNYKELLSFIMHDLRHINAMIVDSARLLSMATKGARIDEQSLRSHAEIIFEQSAALSSWLAIADMHIDPDRFAKEPLRRVSLHEIFFKARENRRRLARERHIVVSIGGEGKFYVDAHPVIDIMPYLLLDNAVKYSPNNGKILIALDEGGFVHRVKIESMGPHVDDDEVLQLGTVGFRGRHARRRTEVGSGQGLALLKTICDYHAARLSMASAKNVVDLSGVPYSTFTVDIEIPKSQ